MKFGSFLIDSYEIELGTGIKGFNPRGFISLKGALAPSGKRSEVGAVFQLTEGDSRLIEDNTPGSHTYDIFVELKWDFFDVWQSILRHESPRLCWFSYGPPSVPGLPNTSSVYWISLRPPPSDADGPAEPMSETLARFRAALETEPD